MIRRFLLLVALLTLTLVSAASAHEHGMKRLSGSSEATTQAPVVFLETTQPVDHTTVQLIAHSTSHCDDAAGKACHNHGTLADCTCPAACAGLFSLAVPSPRLATEASAAMPEGTPRLLAMSSAPPTPPPRA